MTDAIQQQPQPPHQSQLAAGPVRRFFTGLWRNWIMPFAIAAAVLAPIRSAIADWYDVPTGSMEPTILIGDRITANKLAYGLRVPFTDRWVARWADPARGEIVILHSPAGGTRLVKRVIGVPGDTITMIENCLSINGAEVTSTALSAGEVSAIDATLRATGQFITEHLPGQDHTVMLTPRRHAATRTFGPVTVPAGHYLVMGDNRDNSADSRIFGFVPQGSIVGRSSAVAISLDSSWPPRWGRFFTALR